MESPDTRPRLFAGSIASLAAVSLLLQPALGAASYAENFAGMLRFFTIWGNIAACVVMTLIASGRSIPRPVMAALATMLTIIGTVYWSVLSGQHHPVGLDRLTNQAHHTFVPLGVVLWWLAFAPKDDAIVPLMPAIMTPPITYGVFAIFLGQATGFYAYFFLDLPTLGWLKLLFNMLFLALAFGGVGAVLLLLKSALGRKFSADEPEATSP